MKSLSAEDLKIRKLLVAAGVLGLTGFIAAVLVVTVLVAYNFNILSWLE